uniref:Zona pellucida sperm-binding protein 3 n=1 Tax=Canis lupus familiaris TaxID=9615 RepID=ZP3_CANLF|nr:RecName: Full=Zona pellucida sperm-binding protein 3; AltName: Full=Sperm receptor; AltName: Full=Zona pellucida glycoprotein 3; Short=Zp-3; AltName: Full=Zona pellucida protein C; Contains: RecName: Full=Processed zona pellucida sperm-binding protein 3; Flags: Precursor [Canis lupus familiaris]AAA74387.1 zona pellucida C protein [Canis lupus familiaris]
MGLSYGIFICFLLLGGMELCCPQTIWPTETYYPLTSRPPVMVDCLESQLVVTVSKDLFGTGKLIRPADLTLGPENCEPLVSMDTDDVVRFEVGLHECGSRVQVTDNALVYSTFLIHSPRPAGNLSILRTNRAEVPIECHYPRHSNVSSQAILPTWVPFRTTMLFEEKLVFSLRLMEEDWGSEKQSPTFQLGDIAHLQAEVHTGSHMPLRLFVDHCVATLTPDRNAFLHHKIVDFHGCLVDGLYNSSSAFKAPRPRPETLQFTVDVFHFAKDSRNTIYITCHLKVTPADRVPDQLNKACSFIKSTKRWYPVEGSADICRCCNKGSCGLPGRSRRLSHLERGWRKSVSHTRNRRHVTEEAEITVGPLIFLGKASDHGIEGSTSPHTSVMLGLGLATVVSLTLATIVLVLAKRHRTASHPVICPASVSQ